MLVQVLANAHRNKDLVAIFYCDLDEFKQVNDSYGHQVADALLIEAANRIKQSIRDQEIATRVSGDEFIIVLVELGNTEDACLIANKIIDNLSKTYAIGEHRINISLSIGISFYPNHGTDAEKIVKNADKALYTAKHQGKNQYQIYENKNLA